MGPSLQDFQQAQINSANYAARERKFNRYILWFIVGTIVSTLLTLLLAPKLVIPSLIISAVSYGVMRYGHTAYFKAKQWWSNRQANRERQRDGVSLEPLIPTPNRNPQLRILANEDLTRAMHHKASRIAHYENSATMRETSPTSYYDYKHTRALYQYRMLQHTQSAALDGHGEFIGWVAEERGDRRGKKLEILKMLKTEFIDTKKLSIVLKHVNKSAEGKCQLAGDQTIQLEFLKKLKELNQRGGTPLVTLPANPALENDALLKTLLPLVIDMDNVLHQVQPVGNARIVSMTNSRNMLLENTYPLSTEYLQTRIESLERARNGTLDRFRNLTPTLVENEDKSFEIISSSNVI